MWITVFMFPQPVMLLSLSLNPSTNQLLALSSETTKPCFKFPCSVFSTFVLGRSIETCFNILRFHLHCFSLPIMEELCRLDLLINLQSEAFKEMLEDHVNIFLSSFSDSWFYFLGSDLMLILIHSFLLQGWPTGELSPVQPLLIMIAYEKRTGKTIEQQDVESGRIKLQDILTQEDLDHAGQVSGFYLDIINNRL